MADKDSDPPTMDDKEGPSKEDTATTMKEHVTVKEETKEETPTKTKAEVEEMKTTAASTDEGKAGNNNDDDGDEKEKKKEEDADPNRVEAKAEATPAVKEEEGKKEIDNEKGDGVEEEAKPKPTATPKSVKKEEEVEQKDIKNDTGTEPNDGKRVTSKLKKEGNDGDKGTGKKSEEATVNENSTSHEEEEKEKVTELKDPNIGKLVERNKTLPSGFLYPMQGKIVDYHEQSGRVPARWVVHWNSTIKNDAKKKKGDDDDDVVMEEEWIAEDLQVDKEAAATSAASDKLVLRNISERYEQHLEHAMEGTNLVSQLLMVAALEEVLQTLLQQRKFDDFEMTGGTITTNGSSASSTQSNNNKPTHPPLYYSSNPTSYLQPPTATDTTPSTIASKIHVTPSNLSQRVRAGCQWAWDYVSSQQVPVEPPPPPPPPSVSAQQRSSFVIPKLTTTSRGRVSTPSSAAVAAAAAAAAASAPSSSSSRRSSLRQPKTPPKKQVPKPTPVQRGGRIAMWWLDELEKYSQKKQQQKEERGKGKGEKREEKTTSNSNNTSTTTRKRKKKTGTNSIANEDDVMEVVADDDDDDDEEDNVTNNDNDDDEDFSAKDVEAETTAADDDDDVLEDVEKEGKNTLTLSPRIDPTNNEEHEGGDDGDGDGNGHGNDEGHDDEHDIHFENPYLKPTFPAFLEYLARPNILSTSDIQTALCDTVSRIRYNRRKVIYGLPTESLSTVDEVVLDHETPNYPSGKVVLNCSSGEPFTSIQRMDANAFARCKFTLDVIGDEEQTQKLQRQIELHQQDVEFKERKAWDKWRHKGIHDGYTVWPSWNTAVGEWLKEHCKTTTESTSKNDPSISGNADTNGGATNANNDKNNSNSSTGTSNDEALAKSLAAAEEDKAGGGGTSSSTSMSQRRRNTRRAASSGGGKGGPDGVFYGNQSSLTQQQLMEALVRLIKNNDFQTMTSLQALVADDSLDPLRRIRLALGRLVWKRNQLIRKTVTTSISDKKLLKLVAERPLLVTVPPLSPPTSTAKVVAPAAAVAATGSTATTTTTEDGSNKQPSSSAAGDEQQEKQEKPLEDPTTKNDERLIKYVQSLHYTELQLRQLILRHMAEIPVPILATAADDRANSREAMDNADFEDVSSIDWYSTGHDFIGKFIFRPAEAIPAMETRECHWFKVRDYSKSIQSSENNVDDGTENDPLCVERRIRFRAVPCSGPSHGTGQGEAEQDDEEQEIEGTLILTESQVHAGIKAGELQRKRHGRDPSSSSSSPSSSSSKGNPFAGSLGDVVTLIPVDMDEADESDDVGAEIHGRIVGQNNVIDEEYDEVEYRILILPDSNANKQQSGRQQEGKEQQEVPHAQEQKQPKEAFWATIDVRADDASYMCQPVGDSTTWYSIENFDYHQTSPAYRECHNVISWLSRLNKAGPFLEPVDPVALNVPTYFDVVKHPMDISTITDKLENGHYSSIPPGQAIGNTPVSRMLNGPFRGDIELMFDNAMLFNPPDDWIHQAAASLKKTALKKIADMSHSAEQKFANAGRGGAGGGSSSLPAAAGGGRSMYVDDDSDVDMYEYESDQDEDFVTGGRKRSRKRKRSSRGSSGGDGTRETIKADDYSTRAIEYPIRLQRTLRDHTALRGQFASIPINTNAWTFTLTDEWSCRKASSAITTSSSLSSTKRKENHSRQEGLSHSNKNEDDATRRWNEIAELLSLHRQVEEMETSGLRRSTRAQGDRGGGRGSSSRSTANSRGSGGNPSSGCGGSSQGVEYFCVDEMDGPPFMDGNTTNTNSSSTGTSSENGVINAINQGNNTFSATTPTNRFELEVYKEKCHEEYYSKLFQAIGNRMVPQDETGDTTTTSMLSYSYGMYTSGSFPPYLGRVVPVFVSENNNNNDDDDDDDNDRKKVSWEIRSPFIIPAIRWVLRGLIQSGHLTSVQDMSSTDFSSGVLLTNDIYYWDISLRPFEVLDTREWQRRNRASKSGGNDGDDDDDSEEDVELSAYEKMRAERVARNAERLKNLGLA